MISKTKSLKKESSSFLYYSVDLMIGYEDYHTAYRQAALFPLVLEWVSPFGDPTFSDPTLKRVVSLVFVF